MSTKPLTRDTKKLLPSALNYAALGFPVLPLHSIKSDGNCTCNKAPCHSKPGKHPLTKNGIKDATTDPEKIRSWWYARPEANIGLLPDALIVDVDDPTGFHKLLEKHSANMPDCPTAKTGKGFHLYFANPQGERIKAATAVCGCFDIRGNTACVVAPPSLHVSGVEYEWINPLTSQLPEPPEWLLDEIALHRDRRRNLSTPYISDLPSRKPVGAGTTSYGRTVLQNAHLAVLSAEEGTRNDTLNLEAYKIGGFIAGGEIDEQDGINALSAAAAGAGLGADEAKKTLEGAVVEGRKRPLSAKGAANSFLGSAVSKVAKIAEVAISETDWPEPQPIIGIHESEPYPEDALPPRIRNAVHEVQSFTQAPFPLVAATALGAVSITTQHLADVKRDQKLMGPTSLFLLTIADSGERKSTCEGYFTKPIAEYQREQLKILGPEIKRYRAEHAAWEAKKAGLLAAIKNHGKNGQSSEKEERKLDELERCEPQAPRVPRLLLGDRTQESLIRTLASEYPSGGISSSEGGAILGSHSMGNDSVMRTLSTLNVLWDGGALDVGRVGTGSLTMEGVRLTISLQVQEETLKNFISRSGPLARGSGFWARFLMARPLSTQGTRLYREPPKDTPALEQFIQRMREIQEIPAPLTPKGTLEPALLSFTPEAKLLWVDFYNAIERELGEGASLASIKDAASKAADNAARLAALFHVFEHGSTGAIGTEAIAGACRLAAWHLNEARRFFNEVDMPQSLIDAAALEKWLIDRCREGGESTVPKNDIAQRGPNSIRKKTKLDPALQELTALGRLRLESDGRRCVIRLNPALLEARNAGKVD
ncbi:DUF3987 domain-containing protein [Microbulbifer zhoushanensis]|uniref:DUF3987 domain-containing protein n=1 Tax=Microbulbifer zhoushanensis TaxID=2904254 RepID=UPI001F24FB63